LAPDHAAKLLHIVAASTYPCSEKETGSARSTNRQGKTTCSVPFEPGELHCPDGRSTIAGLSPYPHDARVLPNEQAFGG
jgi:hypothetical protein